MDLENRMRQPVGLLSGGQRQLTLLMATIVTHETVAAGQTHRRPGPPRRKRCWSRARTIVAERNITCLMVTHSMTQALGWATGPS